MKKVKVGYFSLVKGSWINDRLAGQRTDALNMLNSLDIELVDCGDLIQNEAQAAEAIEKFADAGVDCLVVHFLTFALGAVRGEETWRACDFLVRSRTPDAGRPPSGKQLLRDQHECARFVADGAELLFCLWRSQYGKREADGKVSCGPRDP